MKKIFLGLATVSALLFANDQLTQEQIMQAQKMCESGNMRSCAAIGEVYQFGLYGIKLDFIKAMKFHKKACGGKIFNSCFNLGAMHENGQGVEQDYKIAVLLYEEACDGGYALGCSNIGTMYYDGRGVKKDIEKGAIYFKRGCDIGNFVSCYNFAVYNYDKGDKSKAKEYTKKACDLGKDDPNIQIFPKTKQDWQQTCKAYNKLNSL